MNGNEIASGTSVQLKVLNTEKEITWTSNNQEVATVDKNGKVTVKGEGNCKITATNGMITDEFYFKAVNKDMPPTVETFEMTSTESSITVKMKITDDRGGIGGTMELYKVTGEDPIFINSSYFRDEWNLTYEFEHTFDQLEPNTLYTVDVTVTDKADNTIKNEVPRPSTDIYTLPAAPDVAIDTAGNNLLKDYEVNNFKASEELDEQLFLYYINTNPNEKDVTYYYKVDNGSWQENEMIYINKIEGNHTLSVKASGLGGESKEKNYQISFLPSYTLTVNPGEEIYEGKTGETEEITAPSKEKTIKFETNGGNTIEPIKKSAPFYQWNLTGGGSINDEEANPVEYTFGEENGTLEATYELSVYMYDTLPLPEKEGYGFEGWYYDEEFERLAGKANDEIEIGDGETTLYAKWTKYYTVHYEDEHGNIHATDGSMEDSIFEYADYNATLRKNTYTTEGYTVTGWYAGERGIYYYNDCENVDENLEELAKANNNEVTVYANWEDTVSPRVSIKVNEEEISNGGRIELTGNAEIELSGYDENPDIFSYTITKDREDFKNDTQNGTVITQTEELTEIGTYEITVVMRDMESNTTTVTITVEIISDKPIMAMDITTFNNKEYIVVEEKVNNEQIRENYTVNDLVTEENFPNTNYIKKVYSSLGQELTGTDAIGSGARVDILNKSNEVIKSYILILKGDIDGDAGVDIFDIQLEIDLYFERDDSETWTDVRKVAGWCKENHEREDGTPDIYDITRLVEYYFQSINW